MLILSELKKEYEKTIEYLMRAALALNVIISSGKRLQLLSYNLKNFKITAQDIKDNAEELKLIQSTIDDLIEKIETQSLAYLFEEIEEIEAWVDASENLSYIYEKEFDD